MEAAGDQVFGGGLYRVLASARADDLNRAVDEAFPDYRGAVSCFATD